MNRRTFLSNCTATALLSGARAWWPVPSLGAEPTLQTQLDESLVGQPVDLGRYGEWKSWLSPEAGPLIRQRWFGAAGAVRLLRLADLPWKNDELDVGVEWPEFRTIHKVTIRYAGEEKAPRPEKQYLEYWTGLTPLQGSWNVLEHWVDRAAEMEITGRTWTYTFVPAWDTFGLGPMRTCKVRLRLENQKQVELEGFEVYGPSHWRMGEVRIEWGHAGPERSYSGRLEAYNCEILEIRPLEGTQQKGPREWTSVAGSGKISGLAARVLYTSGLLVDRSVLTVRAESGDYSFLPAEAIDEQPIDVPNFGVYIRENAHGSNLAAYRQANAGKLRIIDLVTKHPEQTLEAAYEAIQPPRTTLSFVGVDANYQKFGIRPDGNVTVGNTDPSLGRAVRPPSFAVHFATSQAANPFKPSGDKGEPSSAAEKAQHLEEGWLPILVTQWMEDGISFERTDYASLLIMPERLEEAKLTGTEPAVLIARLRIRNTLPVATFARYWIRPWRPTTPTFEGWDKPPSNGLPNAFQANLREDCVTAGDDTAEYGICYVDTHGRGSLNLDPRVNAVQYSLPLSGGEEHVIHTVIPGWPLAAVDTARLRGLAYDRLHDLTAQYWKGRLAEGMQIEVPDAHLQHLFNASLHHFLLATTKDARRGEYYANVAMFTYGPIGSESSPIIQAMDMRGMHWHAEKYLNAFLSTQGYFECDGEPIPKDGGFCQFWPVYGINQGPVLWALAEHYLYTCDKQWLKRVAPQIVSGCDYIIRERRLTMQELPGGEKPPSYGLVANSVADQRDWIYSFMLNGYFYLGLKKSTQVLQEVDPENARRIAAEAEDYKRAILRALKESITLSPVTRLRDNSSVPSVPAYLGLRGFRSEYKPASPQLSAGDDVGHDVELGPLHLVKTEVVDPGAREATWMLNYLEDRFFLMQPEKKHLERLGTDWFNLGGFARSQPYYLHYQDAYLQRDDIPNFLRSFFNTVATSADPYTLTFMEGAFGASEPHKTHEEAWFFHQLRFMLLMEMGNDLFLARGTPRAWLENGKRIAVTHGPSHFGEVTYRIQSFSNQGHIEATVNPPRRNPPANLFIRFRHPQQASIKRVAMNGKPWKDFDAAKEWIKLPTDAGEVEVAAYY